MGLFDTYGDSNARAIDYQASLPQEPPKPQPKWNAWSSPLRGPVSGVAKSLSNLADVVQGYGAAGAIAAEADPVAISVLGKQAIEQGAAEGRRQIATGEATRSEVGDSLRAAADAYKPDPATAGRAEQLIFGLTEGVTKAVAHALTMGPAAPVTFGVDTGMDVASELAAKGIDQDTALKAAAAYGGVNALAFLLPVAGNTWGQTMGLGALSGPVSFMAGQQATRTILSQADYARIAEQYDPLEPWGLAASMLPFGFGALAMRGRTPFKAAPTEAVDAAMVHNLTLKADANRAADGIPTAGNLKPAELVIERRLATKIAQDFNAAVAEYNARPDAQGGKVLNTDVARELSPDYLADRTQSAAVHEPASWFVKELYSRKLAELPPEQPVVFTSGGTGAGKTTAISSVPEARAIVDYAGLVYDTNMNRMDSAVSKIEQALESGRQVQVIHVQRDPVDALVNGALPRAMRQEREFGSGRTVPLVEHAKTHIGAAEVIQRLAERYANDPRVAITIVDNTRGKGGAAVTNLGFVRGFDYNGVEANLHAAAKAEYDAGRISGPVYRATAGDAGQTGGPVPGTVGGAGDQPAKQTVRAEPPEVVAARQSLADLRASGQDIQTFVAGSKLDPAVQNLLVGFDEAKNAKQVDTIAADFGRTKAAKPDQTVADIAADVVEAARSGKEVTPEAGPAKPLTPEAAVAASIRERVDQVLLEQPDLVVRHDADGKPITAADEIAQARAEAANGTDAELGALDADLVRVAADCALSVGAA